MSTSIRSCFTLLLLAVALVRCTPKGGENKNTGYDAIHLKTLDGQAIDLSQYKGKVVFINFWATWCRPCVEEMPSIERAKNLMEEAGIEFLFASNEEAESIKKFRDKRRLDLNYVLAENMEELKIEALPTTLIISPRGELVFSEIGFRQWDEPANLELLTKIMTDK